MIVPEHRDQFSIHTKLHRSKTDFYWPALANSLVSIRNYIALKPDLAAAMNELRLVSIRNYIALKLDQLRAQSVARLVSIRNYIALKQ